MKKDKEVVFRTVIEGILVRILSFGGIKHGQHVIINHCSVPSFTIARVQHLRSYQFLLHHKEAMMREKQIEKAYRCRRRRKEEGFESERKEEAQETRLGVE